MTWTQDAPSYGDMIRVKIKFYYHYGIYVDNATVIQFGLPDNSGVPANEIKVITTDIETFASGEFVETGIPNHKEKLKRRSAKVTVEAALSRLGETGYNILNNNCEHFVNDCMFGEKKSFLDDVRIKIREKLNKN